MANEITITSSVTILKGNLNYQRNSSFRADMTTGKGPSVGAITVDTGGTEIVLSELTTPGICRFTNIDPTNYIQLGVWGSSGFVPILELLPGESYTVRLARNLDKGATAGTGTLGSLLAKANTADAQLLVEAFDK